MQNQTHTFACVTTDGRKPSRLGISLRPPPNQVVSPNETKVPVPASERLLQTELIVD